MGDNVHFATVEDTDTSKSSGFTGFPAPWVADITGVEGNYPNVVAFQKLIKWFWRAKRWTIATDFQFTAGAVTITFDQGVTGGGNVNSVPALTTSEKQLVYQGTGAGPGTSLNFTATGTGSISAVLLVFIDLAFDPTVLKPAIFYNSGALKPALVIDISVDVNDSLGNRYKLRLCSSSDIIPAPDGSIVATVDGENVTLFYKVEINTGITSATFTQLDLTITEFFPYAATDGSPVWNTTTGVQLQDENN